MIPFHKLSLTFCQGFLPTKCASLSVSNLYAYILLTYALVYIYPMVHYGRLLYAFIPFHMLSYGLICFYTLSYAFIHFHMLSYAFICFTMLLYALKATYLLYKHKVSPEQPDRGSRVYRLLPAEAGKNCLKALDCSPNLLSSKMFSGITKQ